jgi:hypothetical protein
MSKVSAIDMAVSASRLCQPALWPDGIDQLCGLHVSELTLYSTDWCRFARSSSGDVQPIQGSTLSADNSSAPPGGLSAFTSPSAVVCSPTPSTMIALTVQSTSTTRSSSVTTRSSSVITLKRPYNPSRLKVSSRSFYHSALALWNTLPKDFRQYNSSHSNSQPVFFQLSPSQFHKKLKTHLFAASFPT